MDDKCNNDRVLVTFVSITGKEYYVTKYSTYKLLSSYDPNINDAFLPVICDMNGITLLIDTENEVCASSNKDEKGMWNVISGLNPSYDIEISKNSNIITRPFYNIKYYTSIGHFSCFEPAYNRGLVDQRYHIVFKRVKDFYIDSTLTKKYKSSYGFNLSEIITIVYFVITFIFGFLEHYIAKRSLK